MSVTAQVPYRTARLRRYRRRRAPDVVEARPPTDVHIRARPCARPGPGLETASAPGSCTARVQRGPLLQIKSLISVYSRKIKNDRRLRSILCSSARPPPGGSLLAPAAASPRRGGIVRVQPEGHPARPRRRSVCGRLDDQCQSATQIRIAGG
jgi:hypothetical protein